jgi:hypothetical protein
MARTLVILGLVLIASGLLWPCLTRLGRGNLPGDISIRRSNFQFFLPVTSAIIGYCHVVEGRASEIIK